MSFLGFGTQCQQRPDRGKFFGFSPRGYDQYAEAWDTSYWGNVSMGGKQDAAGKAKLALPQGSTNAPGPSKFQPKVGYCPQTCGVVPKLGVPQVSECAWMPHKSNLKMGYCSSLWDCSKLGVPKSQNVPRCRKSPTKKWVIPSFVGSLRVQVPRYRKVSS